ncbi:DUF6766 family protein [Streptomyces sp. CA-135486]|uniref:DUF6766 family protein n=1 Tax=Streptomyces sp. CA-135486 TaxID=3240049 RepID=UPI003D8E6907
MSARSREADENPVRALSGHRRRRPRLLHYPRAAAPMSHSAGGQSMRRLIRDNSLTLVFAVGFLVILLGQAVAGRAEFNEQGLRQLQAPIGWPEYLISADFWSRSLQNWQSELLAVASMAILSVYLRQRGSSESKPVGTPHTATGIES